jgi:nucleoside-diphosphate-sugar epimerase
LKALIIGSSNKITENIINKLFKEGYKIYTLSGFKEEKNRFKKVYEQYHFCYENNCIREIFESIKPDITIFTGAFDENYNWNNFFSETVKYSSGLYNILTSFSLLEQGRFIYLSSDVIYKNADEAQQKLTHDEMERLRENEKSEMARIFKARAVKNGEDICISQQESTGLDIITVRIENLCYEPDSIENTYDVCSRMCACALNNQIIEVPENSVSLLMITDAIEFLYQLISVVHHRYIFYSFTSKDSMLSKDLTNYVEKELGVELRVHYQQEHEYIWIENSNIHNITDEFPLKTFYSTSECVDKIVAKVKKDKDTFTYEENRTHSRLFLIFTKLEKILMAFLPFIENAICFIPFFMINNRTVESLYLGKLDCYLIYVLLFAIIYGQQQATFSAILAVAGYCFRQMYTKSGFEVALDYNTYVWIAQLLILGLTVGYLKDQIKLIKNDKDDEIHYLSNRVTDIEAINMTNVKIKNALETQIINQSDSIGKIYEITSSLDKYDPEEVMFYASEVISRLMNCKNVCIYSVSNNDFARLMSSTTPEARKLGNSIRYKDMVDLYEEISHDHIFINKKMLPDYPMMAAAIISEDHIQLILMVWDVPWERMNMSEANRLKIVSYLIQNAVLRASKYIDVLANERYITGTKVLETNAFKVLIRAFINARKKGLTECAILKVRTKSSLVNDSNILLRLIRSSDYLGELDEGYIYILLANTNNRDAHYVTKRINEAGYSYTIPEEFEL